MVLSPNLSTFKKARILMKINGQELKGICVETLVLPRQEDDIVIRAQAISDFDEFDKLCPEPKAPGKLTKDGWEPNLKDDTYRSVLDIYHENRIAYLVVHSLEINETEWDTVDINNPKTWTNYTEDFKKAGLSAIEIGRVVQVVMQANALDEEKLEKARANFLLGQQQAAEELSGQNTEPENSPSGQPVVGSE